MLRIGVTGENIDVIIESAGLARINAGRRHAAGQWFGAIAHCRLAAARVLNKRAAGVLQLRILHRDLQPSPFAGGVALIERTENTDRQQHAGAGVARGRARLAGPAVAFAGDRHRAAAGLRDHVEGEVVLVGAALAEPLHLRVYKAWVEAVQDLPAEPQPLDCAGGCATSTRSGDVRAGLIPSRTFTGTTVSYARP